MSKVGMRGVYNLIPILIFCLASTMINAWVPITARTWLMLIVGCLLCVITAPKYFLCSQFVWCTAYSLIVIANNLGGDAYFDSIPKIVNELGALVMMSGVAYLVFSKGNELLAKRVIIFFAIALLITAIGTTLADNAYSGVVRELAEAQYKEREDLYYLRFFYRWGMSNYILPHALPIMVPALIYIIKNNVLQGNRLLKVTAFLLLVASSVIVWLSGSTTALLFFIVFLFVSLATNVNSSSRNTRSIIVIIFLVLPILLFKDLQIGLLNILIEISGGSASTAKFASHLSDLQDSIIYEDLIGSVDSRMVRYDQTISELSTNILLGTNNSLGGHAAILDRIATLGLLGVIPLFGFFITHIKSVVSYLSKTSILFYVESVIAAVSMMTVKNMFNVEVIMLFCTITPLLFYLGKTTSYQ